MRQTKKSALEILSTLHRRPSSEEALSVSDEDVIAAASALNFPVDIPTMGTIFNIQARVLPLVENMLTGLLHAEDLPAPDYYPLARDGELLYDALWGLGQASGSTLVKRTHLVKTSLGMCRDGLKISHRYFEHMGIVPERVKRGPPMVFLDSGFMGSLFDKIRDWVGILGHVPNQNYRGYLVKSRGEYREMFFAYPVSEQDATELFNVMTNSPYRSVVYSSAGLNRNICAFMQVSPKFTGKYVQTYQREEDGAWDVLPQKNRLVTKSRIRATTNKICVHYAIEQINSIGTEIGWVNDDVVDPVASLLLQRRALEYFSNPDVHDRVYSSGVKVA